MAAPTTSLSRAVVSRGSRSDSWWGPSCMSASSSVAGRDRPSNRLLPCMSHWDGSIGYSRLCTAAAIVQHYVSGGKDAGSSLSKYRSLISML